MWVEIFLYSFFFFNFREKGLEQKADVQSSRP